jgi:hypothetical protein
MTLGKVVKITRENISQICDGKFFQRIQYYILKNGNKLKETDKQELAQRIVVRVYKNLIRKIEQREIQGRRPVLVIKAGRFVNYINKCSLNEIIQYMRVLDKDHFRKVYFSESLDYSKPIDEINKNLVYSGVQVSDQLVTGEFVAAENGNGHLTWEASNCNGNGHKSKRRLSYLKNILPRLDSPLTKLDAQNKYNDSMTQVDEKIEIESLLKSLRNYLDEDEVKVIQHIYNGTIHKEIFDKVFAKTHKNVSIVAKKIFKIKQKISENSELESVLLTSLRG